MKKQITTWICAGLLGLSSLGCSVQTYAVVVDLVEAGPIGEETEGCVAVPIANLTGEEIQGLSLSIGGKEFGENLLAEGEVFAPNEERTWYVVPKEGTSYDVKLTLADGTEYTLHAVPFEDAASLKVQLGEEVAYLQVVPLSDGKGYDTLEAEEEVLAKARLASNQVIALDRATIGLGSSTSTGSAGTTAPSSDTGSYGYQGGGTSSYQYDYDYDTDYSDYSNNNDSSYGYSYGNDSYGYSYGTDYGYDYGYGYGGGSYGYGGGGWGGYDPNDDANYGTTEEPNADDNACLDDGISLN